MTGSRRSRVAAVIASVAFGFCFASGPASAKIASSVVGGGGATTTGGSFKVRGAVGAGAVGNTTSASHTQRSGFWPIYQARVMLLQLTVIPGAEFLAANGTAITTVIVQLRGFGGALTANNTASVVLSVSGDATGGGTAILSSGSATFSVQAGTTPGTVTLSAQVTGVEDGEATFTTSTPVTADGQSIEVREDRRLDIVPTGSGHGSLPLTFTVMTLPTKGTVEFPAGTVVTSAPAVLVGTKIVYRPAANFNGTDRLRYSVTDGRLTSGVANVAIVVTPVNDAPVIVAIPDQAFDELQAILIDVTANDVDGGELTVTVEPLPEGATFDGARLAWRPETNQGGDYPFTVTVADAEGSSVASEISLTINDIFQALLESTLDLLDFGQVRIGEEKTIEWSGAIQATRLSTSNRPPPPLPRTRSSRTSLRCPPAES